MQFNIPFRSKKFVKNLTFHTSFCLFPSHLIRSKGQRAEMHVRLKFKVTGVYYDIK